MGRSRSRQTKVFSNVRPVQLVVQDYFLKSGFSPVSEVSDDETTATYSHSLLQSTWIIHTLERESEFQTTLRELVRDFAHPNAMHAIAAANTEAFVRQFDSVDRSTREKLNLFWILVEGDGSVNVYAPYEKVPQSVTS
ncbi:hypothetical protein LLE49_14275 [Alicyclobacillus tolerans]|uniref:hypothetical protein n=1 Tax=Alicyclobacillus tolerans TaxID=90970 RepID=UPI001F16580E|nr:hypothetical protein [Alicyclobacillus tolerans]MCF8565888.1 hypothetical protein [Alicyclobacillus tolerans]